jgi:ATP-binding cassette subfamily B protein
VKALRLYTRVFHALGDERRVALLLLGANLLLAVAQFAEPLLFGRVIDALARPRASGQQLTFAELAPLVFAWAGFGIASLAGGIGIGYRADLLAHRARLEVMACFFEHVLGLPLGFHLDTHSGRVLKVMSGACEAMWGIWLNFYRQHCSSFLLLSVLLPTTLFISLPLGSLLCALVLGFAATISLVTRRTHELQRAVQTHQTNLAQHSADAIGNLSVVQGFTRVEAELRAMRSMSAELLAAQTPVLAWWAFVVMATRLASTLTVTAILFLGTYLYLHHQVSLGQVVTFMSIASLLIGRLDGVAGFITAVLQEAPKIKEFFEILDTAPTVKDAPGALRLARLAGHVTFEQVSFSYDGARQAVREVELRAAPFETIALVGATGSGKSTTLSLLYRAFDPSAGRILIDGIDLRRLSLDCLRRNIAVVFQEPMLFARTIRENLQVGKPGASDGELWHALERAQAREVVEQLPEGLDTLLSERGRSLSGGERQRLSIARALLKDAPILILDEATSALDATTEHKLKGALQTVMEGRTTLVIAHRLATVRSATRIYVFDQGRIVESGDFDELVARGRHFHELAQAQFLAA